MKLWLVTILSTLILVQLSCKPDSLARDAANFRSNSMANSSKFTANLPPDFIQPTDEAGRRLLSEYGAVFVARGSAVPPKTVVFKDDAEVTAFQASVGHSSETVGGISIELQSAAMDSLKEAAAEAEKAGLTITPRGNDAAKRSYKDTVGLWKSRVEPGLTHWVAQGRITEQDAERIRELSPYEQVPEIFRLEAQGIFFAKDFSKTIIYSVAPPGTSQHLSMLALDVAENDEARVRSILAKHGWYQTVISDLPHFTFLGTEESGLPALGLKRAENSGRVFWIPDI
jgi:hypothetical protein